MKKLALALVASVLVPAAASADVIGVKLKDGYSVRYTFNYESDSGWADIYECEVVVKDDRGAPVATKVVDLHAERFHCGGVARNQSVTYKALVESDSGYTTRECYEAVSGKDAAYEYCGFKRP